MKKTFAALVVLIGLASIQPLLAGTLLVDQVNPYLSYGYGLSNWGGITSDLNAAFGGAGNVTVSGSPLDNLAFLMSFDSLWITTRQPGDPGLSATEQANVATFINAGHRVVMTGENGLWGAWDNSILALVGGSYSVLPPSNVVKPLEAPQSRQRVM
jgi:hypothetical protein